MAIYQTARNWLLLLASVQAMPNNQQNQAVTEYQEFMENTPQNVQDCCNGWCSGPHCFYSNCNPWTRKYSTEESCPGDYSICSSTPVCQGGPGFLCKGSNMVICPGNMYYSTQSCCISVGCGPNC
ncbi:uncharacterized protein BO88DRAFT_241795 [Aspergillus vadensis CBS 113365]|uniref:Uncharacterized protein n=1 Tax=Aspergillus vadensis (strain CBS 113365 / IMI 142717 / IBT 24658) TaxID=1448311 RepID=A0A319BIL5_ASPVC|nr:hypothetical protein BO88DRAFT_241795 [Aspergillus vadensis CBS 113365]PYH63178.1 hypothetical protein BO88DRAFT_241795 [Aspergillus vadensis CBS 113365]